MSWQTYIDDQLLAAGFMYASINAHDGSLWASSSGFVVAADEVTKLATVLKGSSFDAVATSGFQIAGQNYTFTRGEVDDEEGGPSFLQGRCKEANKSSQGVVIYCTNQAIIIGVHDPAYSNGATFGKVNTDIGRVADHMMDSGF